MRHLAARRSRRVHGIFTPCAIAIASVACGSGALDGQGADAGADGAAPAIPDGKRPPQGPPAATVGGFEARIAPLTLMPGEELNRCWLIPLVVEGPSRLVAAASLTVGNGLHHGNITTRPRTGEGVRPCEKGTGGEPADIAKGGAVLFGSSTQFSGTEWQHFPEGMAYPVKEGQEIVARLHYLNAGAKPLEVAPVYRWYTVDAASVTQVLAPFAWDYSKFTIPPLATKTVVGDCDLPGPMHVVSVLPHMHRMGRGFRAGWRGGPLDGKAWLDSKGYDPEAGVIEQYEPSVDLGLGTGAFFSCTWHNTLDKVLEYGQGDDEMCTLFGYAWPPESTYTMAAGDGFCIPLLPARD